ncbi:MAG: hypothetical protein WCO66_01440 [Candidatus Absconditabacteria bacterium]
MSKGGEKIKYIIDGVDNFLDTVTNTLITKGMGPTITYAGKSLKAILSYKANNQIGKKTERIMGYTEDKLTTLLTYLDEKNALLETEIKQDIEQKIDTYTPENDTISENDVEHIIGAFVLVKDERDGKEKIQLHADLKREDARICWYLEKFNELGIFFENENTLGRNLAMLCELNPAMEQRLQEKLLSLVNARIQ